MVKQGILTVFDYATKYPETVPLRKITAEALLDTNSSFGIPEEVVHIRMHTGSIQTTEHKGSQQYAIPSHLVTDWLKYGTEP